MKKKNILAACKAIAKRVDKIWTLWGYTSRNSSLKDLDWRIANLKMDQTGNDFKLELSKTYGALLKLMNNEGLSANEAVDMLETWVKENQDIYESTGRRLEVGFGGGSYDPPTLGHAQLEDGVLNQSIFDKIYLVVANSNPEKTNQTPAHHRLEMKRIASAGDPRKVVCDDEIQLNLKGYTNHYTKLSKVMEKYKKFNKRFFQGADVTLNSEKWKRSDEQLNLAGVVTIPRKSKNDEYKLKTHNVWYNNPPMFVIAEEVDVIEVSSSKVRQLLSEQRYDEAKELLHPGVFEYIKEHKLYGVK